MPSASRPASPVPPGSRWCAPSPPRSASRTRPARADALVPPWHRGADLSFDGSAYQARFDELAESGVDVHGEARLVLSLRPGSVLDAGCGTGRVAIELARHGVDVVGVDVDPSMIAEARRRQPHLRWLESDLASLALGRTFDVVVLAGNVPLFCPPEDRAALVSACASHVAEGGALVAGFQRDEHYGVEQYDAACAANGLELAERWSTWGGHPHVDGGRYAVSVHRRQAARAS